MAVAWKTVGNYFALRMREPSTWVGLLALVSVVGVNISPELTNQIVTAGVAVGGLLMTLFPEAHK